MSLLFVNRFYWPETPATGQLLTDLAEGLAATGRSVTVITSADSPSAPRHEVRRGVTIVRVAGTRWSRHGLIGKAFDFATFYFAAVGRVFSLCRRSSTVVAMTDPPMLGVGIWMATRCRGGRFVHWIQDIYPEIAVSLSGHSWLQLLRPVRNLAWRRADACVTLGFDMARVLARAGVNPSRVMIVPNWAPIGLGALERGGSESLRREWNLSGKFVVAYSGNLGRVHDLEPVIALAEALRSDPHVALVIIGDGAQRTKLKEAARQQRLPNLQFQPPQSREGLTASLAVGDLHLVTLRPGCEEFVFPSKLYGIAAAGRPVLFIGPPGSEVAQCVSRNGLGIVAARDDIPGMATAIRQLAANSNAWLFHSSSAQRFAAHHTCQSALDQWQGVFAAVERH